MEDLKFFHVVARAVDGSIGFENKLMWSIPEDMKFFKQLTSGHICIMGRKTYESIGRVLPSRIFIVISKTVRVDERNLLWATDIQDALNKAATCARFCDGDAGKRAFIIGGGEVYNQTFDVVSGLYITNVLRQYRGDVHYVLPEDFNRWSLLQHDMRAEIPYTIELYTRGGDQSPLVFLGAAA